MEQHVHHFVYVGLRLLTLCQPNGRWYGWHERRCRWCGYYEGTTGYGQKTGEPFPPLETFWQAKRQRGEDDA